MYKCLAYLLSLKRGVPYCSVMAWLHCCISFSLLCSVIDCLRGAHFHNGCRINYKALDLSLVEGQVKVKKERKKCRTCVACRFIPLIDSGV